MRHYLIYNYLLIENIDITFVFYFGIRISGCNIEKCDIIKKKAPRKYAEQQSNLTSAHGLIVI